MCFSRGVYGTEKHFKINEKDQSRISYLIENFMLSSHYGKNYQWSCEDLKEKLQISYDEYEINICLQLRSKKIFDLGHNFWSCVSQQKMGINDAMIEVLKKNGTNMNSHALSEGVEYKIF